MERIWPSVHIINNNTGIVVSPNDLVMRRSSYDVFSEWHISTSNILCGPVALLLEWRLNDNGSTPRMGLPGWLIQQWEITNHHSIPYQGTDSLTVVPRFRVELIFGPGSIIAATSCRPVFLDLMCAHVWYRVRVLQQTWLNYVNERGGGTNEFSR